MNKYLQAGYLIDGKGQGMLKAQLSPSMMCVNVWENASGTLSVLEDLQIDYLHIDIMDGHFTPNITLGTDFVKSLRRKSRIPLDIHMMVEEPENMLGWLDMHAAEYVSVHVESTRHLQRVLAQIRACGAKPMAALNPATSLSTLENVLNDIDGILLMTVNPGFAGQKLVPQTIDKIQQLRCWLDRQGYPQIEIEVDGNVSFSHAALMRAAGANLFVGGTSSVFSPNSLVSDNIIRLRSLIATDGQNGWS